MLIEICLIILAYLIGSIPYMLLLSRAMGFDISKEPDFHIAMYRKVGRLAGFSGVLVDFLKGLISVLIGYFLNLELWGVAGAAVAATVGQMWPVFQKFNGEKGNTTGLGAAVGLTLCYDAGWVLLAGVVFMLAGFLIRTIPRFMAPNQTFKDMLGFGGPVSNSLPICMILGFLAMPVVASILQVQWAIIAALWLIFILIVVRRLTADVRKDIREGKVSTGKILFNRLLLDRSYY
jgi:glycerol-3-phosphate acyltransferase PlsY